MQEHAQSYTQNVVEDWGHDDNFNLVQINHQRNPLKSMLLNLFVSSLKRTIPEKRWDTYLVAGGEWSEYDVSPTYLSSYFIDRYHNVRGK